MCNHNRSGAMGIVINKQVVKSGGALQLSDMLSNIGIEGMYASQIRLYSKVVTPI